MKCQLRLLSSSSSSRHYSKAQLQLLTYPMAFNQPNATVPLLNNNNNNNNIASVRVKLRGATQEQIYQQSHQRELINTHRWVRGPDELCVAAVHRSKNVNKVNTYVATYKYDDPQWAPLLLPQVTFRPRNLKNINKNKENEKEKEKEEETNIKTAGASPPLIPPTSSTNNNNKEDEDDDLYDRAIINHSKLTSLECMARHVNFSLRHIVQKGHGVYLIHHAQHSILQPKGIIEKSFVTCSYGIRGERLRTDIIHVGPINTKDILEFHKQSSHNNNNNNNNTIECNFNFHKANITRGVIAISQVEGYGTWFQRKPMLWQRSRRIGALQSQLGAFQYKLISPHFVGKHEDCEVFLLKEHLKFIGSHGGVEAVGIVAATQIAQQHHNNNCNNNINNCKLYLGEFEAPVITALDAVHQLAHASALRAKLVTPANHNKSNNNNNNNNKEEEKEEEKEEISSTEFETLVPVSWATHTPPPYVPLEADLPFKLQMSRPAVIGGEINNNNNNNNNKEKEILSYPTGGTVGSPFVRGAPQILFEYNLHQGVDHYVFDDAPSARPMKWWSQKSNLPYSGYIYFVRSKLINTLTPSEEIPNPFEPELKRKAIHNIVPPSKNVQRRINRYKKLLQEGGNKRKKSKKATNVNSSVDKKEKEKEEDNGVRG